MQGVEKVKRRERSESGGRPRQGVDNTDSRQSIAYFCGHAQIHSRSTDLEAENHEKYTILWVF